MKKYIGGLVLLLFLAGCAREQKQLSYSDVVHRLNDLDALARLPKPGEKCAQWSSYDRRSRYDESTGKYVEWYANGDGANQYIRMEGENAVLAEMTGPGAIVRIWSARPDTGHVQIFIDDNPEPVIDMPFTQFFDRSVPPFDYEGLVYTASEGCNNFVPITYRKSCKVVATPNWGVYYHFNYITLPGNTGIEPFSMSLTDKSKAALQSVNDFIVNKLGESPYRTDSADSTITAELTIGPGQSVQLADLTGPGAIKSFKVYPSFTDREDAMTGLRKLVLTMTWDGEARPSVWCPLGDFFGTTPAINPYKTLPMGMTEKLFYSYWTMPYAEKAVITIENQGEKAYSLSSEIVHGRPGKPIENYARFHAWWHGDVLPVSADRWPDWTLLETSGRGRYIGTMLHVMNPDGNSCREAAGEGHAWWGEGDEKFFVDGETFPSTFGTGSEDYFGYAWGDPAFFEKAFHSQSMTTGNTAHQTIVRWHITDNIPFQKSFDGYIEKYYPNDCGTKYNAMVYWYGAQNSTHALPMGEITVDHVLLPPVITTVNNPAPPGGAITVSIQAKAEAIRYTIDGTEPNANSALYVTPLIISEPCTVKAKYYAKGKESPTASAVCRILTWLEPDDSPAGLKPGLHFSYYEKEGPWQQLPDYSTMQPVKSGTVETVTLGMQQREDHWGVVYTGYIRISKPGVYTFYLVSDDGSRLYIGDQLVVDHDMCHAETEMPGGVALKAGIYPLRLDFFENDQSQALTLLYSGPGVKKQVVPAGILFMQ